MRYLVFANTPAHVHLYRHAVAKLEARGHEVVVAGRDYACTKALLDYYDLPYRLYGRQGTNAASLARRLPGQFRRIFGLARAVEPDLVFGRGPYAAFAGTVARAPVVLVLDSEPSTLAHRVSSRFADSVLTPNAFKPDLGPNHYRFRGLTECAYLHPDLAEPDPGVRAELGVGDDERFVLVRYNAFDALHDVGGGGLSVAERRSLIERLAEHATVVVSDEGGRLDLDALPARPYDLHPARMHDALAEASLLVADTGTMVTEAALLGTPAIRASPRAGADDMGEFEELERHGLAVNLKTYDEVLSKAESILSDSSAGERWRQRRDGFLGDRVNLAELLVDVAERPTAIERLVAEATVRTERETPIP